MDDGLCFVDSEILSMVEVYSGCVVEKGVGAVECDEKGAVNIVPYHNDSDIDQRYGAQEVVHVVYQEDRRLIMNQKRESILGVFQSKSAAKAFRNEQLNEDPDRDITIQQMVVHDAHDSDS